MATLTIGMSWYFWEDEGYKKTTSLFSLASSSGMDYLSPSILALFERNRKQQHDLANTEANLSQTKATLTKCMVQVTERGSTIEQTQIKMDELERSSQAFARASTSIHCCYFPSWWWLPVWGRKA